MELALFSIYKDCVSGFWVCTSCKINQSGLKEPISSFFWWKSLNFVNNLARICDKKIQWKEPTIYFVFKRKANNIFLKNFIEFYQNWRNFTKKIPKKAEWNQRNSLYFLESLDLDISLSKTKIKKIFLIPYFTLNKLSNDTSLNSLRWIYRSAKIDWTKKNPIWVYSSSPPLKRGRNNDFVIYRWSEVFEESWALEEQRLLWSFEEAGITKKIKEKISSGT